MKAPDSTTGSAPACRCAAALLFLALMATAASTAASGASGPSGGTQSEGPRDLVLDRVEVQRVVVDLVAERNGEPVLDLRPEEITVYEDGEPVEILGFSPPQVVSGARQPGARTRLGEAATGANDQQSSAVEGPATLVLFLDELHLKPFNKKKVLKQARSVSEDLIDAGGRVTVVAFDGQLRLLLPPSADKKALRQVLDEEMNTQRMPMMASLANVRSAVGVIHQRMVDETQERGTEGGPGRPGGGDPCVDIGGLARTSAQQAAAAVDQSLGGLRLLVGTLGRYEGRKSLLYVSDGIPLVPGMEVYTYAIEMCDGTAAHQGIPNAIDTRQMGFGRLTRWDPRAARSEMMDYDTTRAWREIAAYANAQQVSIYPLQATGLQGHENSGIQNFRTTMTFNQAMLGNPRDSLFMVAEETGGEAFFNTNQFGDALVEAASDVQVGYQLSFEPRPSQGAQTRAIEVRVSRPGVQLRHRKSFTTRTAASQLVDLAMSGLVFGGGANPLGVGVAVGEPTPGKPGETSVNVKVRVPLEKLAMVPVGEDRVGRFTVAVGGQQSNGRYLPIGFREIDVRASEVDQATQSFEYEVEVPYRSKGVKLSIAVRDDVGGVEALRLADAGES